MAGLRAHGAAYEAAFAAMAQANALPDFKARYPLLSIDAERVELDDAAIDRAIGDLLEAGRGRVDVMKMVGVVFTGARLQRMGWLGELVPFTTIPLAPDRSDLFKLLERASLLFDRHQVGDLDPRTVSQFQHDAATALRFNQADGGPQHGDHESKTDRT